MFHIILIFLILLLVVSIIAKNFVLIFISACSFMFFLLIFIFVAHENKERVCSECGYYGEGDTPGSFLIELILWFSFIVPGIVYSLWRLSNRGRQCPACKNRNLIDKNSPIGRDIIEKYHIDIS